MLELAGCSFCYGERAALSALDLQVAPGEFLGVLGPNGSGKSTLLKLLAGVLTPSQGEVRLEGRSLAAWSRPELAARVAFVPQRVDFPFPFTAREVVMMGRYARMRGFGLKEEGHEQAVRAALERTGTGELAERRITELSGGEAQRVRIAQALAQEGRWLLLDEPTSHLDVCHQLETMELLSDLRSAGQTVVMALHDLNLAAAFCTRLLVLRGGKLLGDGPPARVLQPDRLREAFSVALEVQDGSPVRVLWPARIPPTG